MARVLIISDDLGVMDRLKKNLENKHHNVTLTCDSCEGMVLHRKSPFNLIITELFLPTTEGLEIILKLSRDADPKIIAISSGIGSLSLAKRMGAHRSFAMPLDTDEVMSAATDLLGGIL